MELIRSELVAKDKFDLFNQIEEMIKKKTKPFFIWELEFEEVFKNGQGFDIVIANPPYVQLQKNGGKLANELKDQGYETFVRTADIYCLFYEKGINLLKKQGILCYITSNKWMRAGYGKNLRAFLAKNSNPLKLIDYGGNKIFETATVDVNTLIASKEKNFGKTLAATIADGCTKNLSDYLQHHYTINSFINSDNWVLLNPIEMSIKEKIESNGNPLSNWDIAINYGIKTGYNDAFIINENIRDMLIASDPNSAELIRPILRGKDIKRYNYKFANLWLIYIPWHFPLQNDSSIKGASKDAEVEFKKQYPAIYSYLYGYKEKLSNRNKAETGIRYEWYALQRWGSKYSDDFFEQNIAWQRITHENTFCLTDSNMVILDSMAFINGAKNKTLYLLAVLNSSIIKFWMKKNVPEYGSSGYRLSNQFVIQIPVPINPPSDLFEKINNLVSKGFSSGSFDYNEIDNSVYKLFGLSADEIEYISAKKYLNL